MQKTLSALRCCRQTERKWGEDVQVGKRQDGHDGHRRNHHHASNDWKGEEKRIESGLRWRKEQETRRESGKGKGMPKGKARGKEECGVWHITHDKQVTPLSGEHTVLLY